MGENSTSNRLILIFSKHGTEFDMLGMLFAIVYFSTMSNNYHIDCEDVCLRLCPENKAGLSYVARVKNSVFEVNF